MDQPTPAQELEMIEMSIEQAKEIVARSEALKRLCKNKDFKKLFLDYYLGTEVARTVKLMADPSSQSPAHQESLHKRLISVGQVDQFMRATLTMGDMAQEGIAEDEQTREQLLAEEGVI